jgi:hypothetical protein
MRPRGACDQPRSSPADWGRADVAGERQLRVAVVSVTTSGLVTTLPKSLRPGFR